jgi:hypothetical protein
LISHPEERRWIEGVKVLRVIFVPKREEVTED